MRKHIIEYGYPLFITDYDYHRETFSRESTLQCREEDDNFSINLRNTLSLLHYQMPVD